MTPGQIDEMRADMEAGTPGPWRKAERSESTRLQIFGSDDARIAWVEPLPIAMWAFGRQVANARRIARVPQLEAEVIRLREKLERIANTWNILEYDDAMDAVEVMRDIACDGLKGRKV